MKKIYSLNLLLFSFLMLALQGYSQCDYSLELYDSWGDGWNGAEIEVTINGNTLAGSPFTIGNGTFAEVPIVGVNSGDSIGLQMLNLGAFPAEVSYSLFDFSGSLVFNQMSTAPLTLRSFEVNCPPCAPPTNLFFTNLLDVSADFHWNAGAGVVYFAEVGPSGFVPGTGTDLASEIDIDTTFSVSGLMPETDYSFYVSALCATGDTVDFIGPLNFTTNCAVIVAPWLYDVETAALTTNSTIEDCWVSFPNGTTNEFRWNVTTNGTPSGGTGPSSAFSPTNYFYVEASNGGVGSEANLISPLLDVSAFTTPAISFYYHMFGGNMGSLYVDIDEGNGWVNVDTIVGQQHFSNNAPWTERLIPLVGVGNVLSIRFRAERGNGFAGDIAIDNINLIESPTCFVPTNINIATITDSSAEISWVTGGASTWQLELVNGNGPQGSGVIYPVTTNPFTIPNLNPNTDYSFYLQDSCAVDDVSSWTGAFPFTTLCVTETLPWTYNVETAGLTSNSSIADCWSSSPTGTTAEFRWNVASGGTPSGATGPITANSPTQYFFTEASSGFFGSEALLISPPIDISSLTTPAVLFNYHMFGNAIGNLFVEVNVGNGWIAIDSIMGEQQTMQGAPWLERISVAQGISGNVMEVRFRGVRGNGFQGDMAIDDISVIEGPTCFTPTDFSVAMITDSSAELSWVTGGATDWQIEFVPGGGPQGSGIVVPSSTNPFTLTGLNPNTSYDVYIQDSCAIDDVSFWSSSLSFITPCVTEIAPWFYNVETAAPTLNGSIEDCWTSNPFGVVFAYRWNITGNGTTFSGNTGPSFAQSGSNYFFTEASQGAIGSEALLMTPDVDISALTTPSLFFHYHFFGATIDRMNIDVFDGNVWIDNVDSIVGQTQQSQDEAWLFHTTDLSAFSGVIQVRFRGIRGTGFQGDMAIDDIRIDNIPTCFAPTELQDTVLSPSSVELSWISGGATNWVVEYGPEGFIPGTGTRVSATTNPFVLTGLPTGMDYDWYVQDSCSATDLSWYSADDNFRLPALIFCDSSSFNFTYCHPDETIDVFTYSTDDPAGQLHFVFNDGFTGTSVDLVIYDGPDVNSPIIYSSTGNDDLTGLEFTSSSSIVTIEHNSLFANPCAIPLDFDVNCCRPSSSIQEVYICVDSSFTLADSMVVTLEGAYDAVIENSRGCDSTINYFIFTIPDTTEFNDILCQGDVFVFPDGTSTNMPGQYQRTVANQNGCDSTINYTLELGLETSSMQNAEICQGESFVLPDGIVVSAAGTYTSTLINEIGCDSVITTNVVVNLATTGSEVINVCQGQEFELPDGVMIDSAGTFTSVVTNFKGCDSTVTTTVNMVGITFSQEIVELCGSETYTLLNGDIVSEAGEYNVSISNTAGCDSIVTVFVSKCNAIGDLDRNELLSIFPNPAVNSVNLILHESLVGNTNFKIVNAVGQTIYEEIEISESELELNVSKYSNGIYFIVLSDSENTSLHKFVIAK